MVIMQRVAAGGGGYGAALADGQTTTAGPACKRQKLAVHELTGSVQTYKQLQESV